MSPACGAAGREGPPQPPPRPTKEHFAELLVPPWPYGRLGSDFWNRPSFYLHDNFVCPPPAFRCSQRLGAVPPMLPPGACCEVTPVEGAGEWNWRERLFPGARRHSYELTEPRTVERNEGGKMSFKTGEPLGKELRSSGQVCVLARSSERIKPVISVCLLSSWPLCRLRPAGARAER